MAPVSGGLGTGGVAGGGLTGASSMGGDPPDVMLGGVIPEGERGAASCATAGVNAPMVKNPTKTRTRRIFICVSVRKTPGRSGDVHPIVR
ncbi:MAG TPA: hypothetical protein VF579_10615, partial [Candidatus Methylomirabilis sp.]